MKIKRSQEGAGVSGSKATPKAMSQLLIITIRLHYFQKFADDHVC